MSEPARTQLLAAYADEHRDHLGALRALLAAGASGDLEDAYRHAHSLKGAARAVNLAAVVHLAHALESLVEAWWEGRSQPDAETIRLAGDALDAIEDLSALLLAGQPAPQAIPPWPP
ncbi:MAG: Hpt domain-containing protein [Magnetospirillum sp.]|nr:Hpt domain-containing protein [Magnetospirillum sp.]